MDWEYQKGDARRGEVVDFAPLMADMACLTCGAEAYMQASPDGSMRIRWRCEHSQWADENEEDAQGAK